MEKLKLGDEVYNERYNYGSLSQMRFRKIVRLTATLAITDCNDRIKNDPKDHNYNQYFYEHGSTDMWKIVTPEAIDKFNKFKEEITASNWFFKQKFTAEQKVIIYKLLNPES